METRKQEVGALTFILLLIVEEFTCGAHELPELLSGVFAVNPVLFPGI